jgi:NAD+ synthase
MITLYYYANCLNYLVVGTSNRSEIMVGYATKHGDSGADILPLGNILKYQVFELAKYLGVTKNIIDKPPSAGLWNGQTDEKELGITYAQLDKFLSGGEIKDNIIKERIQKRIKSNRHKRIVPAKPPF